MSDLFASCDRYEDMSAVTRGVDAAVQRVRVRSEGLSVRTVLARLRAALADTDDCPAEETLLDLAGWISRGELTDDEVANARYDTSGLP